MPAHPSSNPLPIDTHDVRRVSVAAEVDPRTVENVLRGGRTNRSTRKLVCDALRSLGFGHLIPSEVA